MAHELYTMADGRYAMARSAQTTGMEESFGV
jgi:hypothetical protein